MHTLSEMLRLRNLISYIGQGLVVPVVRNADTMGFADVEKEINKLARKANDGTISIDEMAGGTFTISNGGVYGSLMSAPIINPPQVCYITSYLQTLLFLLQISFTVNLITCIYSRQSSACIPL